MKVRISWPGQFDISGLVEALAMKAGVHPDGVETIEQNGTLFICFIREYQSFERAKPEIGAMQNAISGLLGRTGEVFVQETTKGDFVKVA